MKKILLVFIALIPLCIFAEGFKNYEQELLVFIPKDNPDVPLVFAFDIDFPNGPRSICFDRSGQLYISDPVIGRIIVYSNDFNFIRTVNGELRNELIYSSTFIDNGNLYSYGGSQYFQIDLRSGNVISEVYLRKSKYNTLISNNFDTDFVKYNDLMVFYLLNDELIAIENPDPSYEENNNNILNPEETAELINSKFPDDILVTGSNHLLINGELQTRDFMRFFSYWNDYYDGARDKLSLTGKLFGENSANSMRYIGRDQDDNWYWDFGKYAIVVYNSKGQVIENFLYNSRKSKTLPAVHPSGDVYVMDYDEEGIYLYKISRQW